jgi:thioredoxin reductase (NADPH)
MYLGRFRRRVLVIDAGESRALLIPKTRNVAGFPDGVGGTELLALFRAQAEKYGAEFLDARADAVRREAGAFHIEAGNQSFEARALVLATGVANNLPPLVAHDDALARGLLRYCPICDAHEAIDKRIGILGHDERSVREREFLLTYSADVSLIACSADACATMTCAGAKPLGVLQTLGLAEHHVTATLTSGAVHEFDTLYSCMGVRPGIELAQQLGVALSPAGGIRTDKRQRTNVPCVYAVGDVVEALDQISVATGHAAIAATNAHNELRAALPARAE